MSWVDVAIIAVMVGSAILSGIRGVTRELFGFLGVVFGVLVAGRSYSAAILALFPDGSSSVILQALAFLVIFVAVAVIFTIVGILLSKAFHFVTLRWLDALLGCVLGAAKGALVVGVLLMLGLHLAPGSWSELQKSRLAPPIVRITSILAQLVVEKGKEWILPEDRSRREQGVVLERDPARGAWPILGGRHQA